MEPPQLPAFSFRHHGDLGDAQPGPPAKEGDRSDDPPVPIPATGQDFCECFQPWEPLCPPISRGPGCGCKRDPRNIPLFFQLNKTSPSRQCHPSGATDRPPHALSCPPALPEVGVTLRGGRG